MRNLTHSWLQSGNFFPKIGAHFSNYRKTLGYTSPFSLSSYASESVLFSTNFMANKVIIIKNSKELLGAL